MSKIKNTFVTEATNIVQKGKSGQNSLILNGGDAVTYSDHSTAAGYNTSAGSMAFDITAIEPNKDNITEDATELTITLDSITDIEVGLEVSVQLENNIDFIGTISSVDSNSNTVTVTFRDGLDTSLVTSNTGSLWIPSRPDLGTKVWGTGALAEKILSIDKSKNITIYSNNGVYGNSEIVED